MTDALDTYREVRFDGRRTFRLTDERVEVEGRNFLRSDFRLTVRLEKLVAEWDTIRLRNQVFTAGMCVAVVGFVVATLISNLAGLDAWAEPVALPGVIALGSLILCLATWRKVEYAVFNLDTGGAGLSIARAGPDQDRFDEFVAAISRQVQLARSE